MRKRNNWETNSIIEPTLKTKENTFCGILLVSFLGMRENLGKLLDMLGQF